MLIFLYGPDAYRVRAATQQIVQRYKEKHKSGVNLYSCDLAEGESAWTTLESAAKSVSFLDEVKLVVVRNVFSSKDNAVRIEKMCEEHELQTLKDVVLLISEVIDDKTALSVGKTFLSTLKNSAKPLEYFDFLSGARLNTWIKNEAMRNGATIEPAAVEALLDVVGVDSWSLANEITKLSNYTKQIKVKDVAVLVSGKTDLNIFNFTDALGEKNKAKAFAILSQELAYGRDPYYLLSMVIFQFRNLLMLRSLAEHTSSSADAAKKSGLHPFVTRKLFSNIKKFDLDELKNRYSRLSDIDIGIKEGRLDLEEELYNFVLK